MGKLLIEHGESFSNKVKHAILYGMLPKEIQERALDKCSIQWNNVKEEVGQTVRAIVEEAKSIAKTGREQYTSEPMAVYAIGGATEGGTSHHGCPGPECRPGCPGPDFRPQADEVWRIRM